jgi:hypothetical protein
MDTSILSEFRVTLTEATLWNVGYVFCCIFLVIGFTSKYCLQDDTKRLSWIISLVNSFVMSFFGVIYIIKIFPFFSFSDYSFHFEDRVVPFCLQTDDIGIILVLWFALANIFDLIFGILFYRKQVQLLTGYIHHTMFIWICIFSITGNGLFTSAHPFTAAFIFHYIEEIPTFILALGSVFPNYRSDYGFGITFFFLRIVYHGFLFFLLYKNSCTIHTMWTNALSMCMHINWFYAWSQGMAKRRKKLSKDKEDKKK